MPASTTAKSSIGPIQAKLMVHHFGGEAEWTLLAEDPGGGTISMDDYKRRCFDLDPRHIAAALSEREAGRDPIPALAKFPEIAKWAEEVAPILIPATPGGPTGIKVRIEPKAQPPREFEPGLSLPGLNTLSYAEIVAGFERAVAAAGGEAFRGPKADRVDREDGLPWFEVGFQGSGSASKGKAFARALARETNLRILFNRIEAESKSWVCVGCMDFDPDEIEATPVPAFSRERSGAEHMEDYGEPVMPPKAPKAAKPSAKKAKGP